MKTRQAWKEIRKDTEHPTAELSNRRYNKAVRMIVTTTRRHYRNLMKMQKPGSMMYKFYCHKAEDFFLADDLFHREDGEPATQAYYVWTRTTRKHK